MFDLVTENSFDLNKTKEYNLSIQVNLDGFSFFIVNPNENQLVAFKHEHLHISNENFIARRLNEWLEKEELLSHQYGYIQIVHWTKKFALVPYDWADDNNEEKLVQLLFNEETKDEIEINSLKDHGKSLVFTIPSQLQRSLRNRYPDCSIFHPLKKISNNLPELHLRNGFGLVLAISQENFYLLLYNKEDILLMNQYNYSHANDVVYYVLSVLRQLKISPRNTELWLSGTIKKEDEIKKSLQSYFDSTNFLSPITSIHFNPIWFNGSEHRFVALY